MGARSLSPHRTRARARCGTTRTGLLNECFDSRLHATSLALSTQQSNLHYNKTELLAEVRSSFTPWKTATTFTSAQFLVSRSEMDTTIASVATIQFPAATHILRTSWCPDKDLLVVFSRVSHQTKMTLYKMQGSKKWEAIIQSRQVGKTEVEVVGVAWSPDAQLICVISNPALVAIHSTQDGHVINEIPFSSTIQLKLTDVWWFREEKRVVGNGLPDIFKRGDNITGSAFSIMKGLPLLDPVQDDTKPLNSNDLFAFQGPRPRAAQITRAVPASIGAWPCFPPNLEEASIASNTHTVPHAFPEAADEPDDTNLNSVLAVADNVGQVHLFMEGSYLLGTLALREASFPRSVYKLRDHFFAHLGPAAPGEGAVDVRPLTVKLPYLMTRHCRDVARVSTAARELVSYVIHVIKDMRDAWFGSEPQSGARDLGPKWIQSLEARQAKEFGQEDPHALLDLTCLLTTGRSSEALMDYLGSGEHMSERSMQKWETTMTDALVKLRDMSEKRAAPALQRLYLLLQEVRGWAALPEYAVCQFKIASVEACLEYTASAIIQSSWLAAAARKELLRFREFMKWIRYETSRMSTAGDPSGPRPQHDILEVNEYLTSSLVVSPIDKWFMGPGARIKRESLGVPNETTDISTAVANARAALARWDQTVQEAVKPRDLSHIERNLDTLLQALAARCQEVFMEACKAAARSCVPLAGGRAAGGAGGGAAAAAGPAPLIRERTVPDESKPDNFLQHLAIRTPPGEDGRSYLCLARLQQGLGAMHALPAVEVSVLECCAPADGSGDGSEQADARPFDVLDVDFFDAHALVLVYRPRGEQGARIATVGYANILYHTIPAEKYVNGTPREALMDDVLARLAGGELPAVPMPIVQSRPLGAACATGGVTLAVNGRAGRRVSCVLDEAGLTLEVLDMEADEDEEDVELEGAGDEDEAEAEE